MPPTPFRRLSFDARLALTFGLLSLGLLSIACTASPPDPSSDEASTAEPVRVFVAASLTDVVQAIVERYDDAPVQASFGASSALARQIRDGAPADVFVSASPQWIDFLREAGALAGEPIVLARNRLVAIAAKGSDLATTAVAEGVVDPRSLLDRLAPADRVAIADEGVPAGEYARAALASRGLLDEYRSHLVGQSDVRAVLHAVERGELPAGFVYSTDAAIAEVEILFAFDPADHPPIEYQAVALDGSPNPDAASADAASADAASAFLAHLESDEVRALLADAGFDLP